MHAKKVNKFKMKGHSIPGIKGFKGTSKEDGRAASSAFQIKTPLLEETRTTLDANTEVILPDVVDRSFSTAQKFGESYKAAGGKKTKKKKDEAGKGSGTYDEYAKEEKSYGDESVGLTEAEWRELNLANQPDPAEIAKIAEFNAEQARLFEESLAVEAEEEEEVVPPEVDPPE
jgi:hypothetical protein